MRYKLDLLKAPTTLCKKRTKTSGRPIPCPLGGDESEGSDKIMIGSCGWIEGKPFKRIQL